MPTAANNQGNLNRLPIDRLPKEVVGDIFTKAEEHSSLLNLGQRIRVGINETVISKGDQFPEAGQVGTTRNADGSVSGGGTSLANRENAYKPLAGLEFGGSESFSPVKLAVIVTVSEEFAREDVDGLYAELAGKLSGAVARAADLAAFHGKDALRGTELLGIATNNFINKTANRYELDMTAPLTDQFLEGLELLGDDFEPTHWAADPKLRVRLATSRDAEGNTEFTSGGVNFNQRVGSLFGLPVHYSKLVNGKLGAAAASDVKMMAGDFSQFAYGWADDIRVKVSDQATVNGVSMWETNQIAVLAEATFGWYVNDTDAFVAFEDGVATEDGGSLISDES